MSDHSTEKLCTFPNCGRKREARGFCKSHARQLRQGYELTPFRPGRTRRAIGAPVSIEYDEQPCPRPDLPGPCRIFRGGKNKKGYGNVSVGGRIVSVHRYVWERDVGPIPAGLEIDHQCRVRACVNVQHLRVVTHKVNATENIVGANWQLLAAKTHCPNGHEYNEANTRHERSGGRRCRTCKRESGRSKRRSAK